MQIVRDKDIDKVRWSQLLTDSPYATFFQSPDCYDFYCTLSFLEPFLIAVEENDKLTALVCGYFIADGGVVKRQFSRRAIIPGGVLLGIKVTNDALHLLLNELKNDLSKKAIYIEIRNYSDYTINVPDFLKAGFNLNPHLNFHVPTLSVESAHSQLNATKRRDVKLSIKNGAVCELSTSNDDIIAYYSILEELYRTKVKLPLFPLEFFEKILTVSDSRFFVLKYQGEVIGGSVCVVLPGRVMYEWFVCGLDGKYKNVYPSTLVTWSAIEYAAANGYQYFDMMGAGKPDASYGVREFKSKFGGTMVEHGRFLYVCKPMHYRIGKLAVKLIKKLK